MVLTEGGTVMKDIRHFIWDFDGTLFDTYPVIIRCMGKALAGYGRDCGPLECMELMLDSIGFALDFYSRRFGIPREELTAVFDGHKAAALKELEAAPMEGAREVLEAILKKGGKSYIFSHRRTGEIRLFLDKYGLTGLFEDILGPDSEGFAWKPAPDGILRLMARHGMTREDTVMIGDRDCDLGSARNAGIRTAHLICAAVPQDLRCDWRLEDLRQLLTLI